MASCAVHHVYILLLFIQIFSLFGECANSKKSDGSDLIEVLVDAKDLKKVLRTKNNVLVLFVKNGKESNAVSKTFALAAEEMKGQATLVVVDCGGDGKKLCKKLKVTPEPTALKHYKNGEFHKDYDRKLVLQSMVNFLKDPSGDTPWEEDDSAKDVFHISDSNTLSKLLHKEKVPVLVMFYAPWCGFCKRMKPEYEAAATELKGHSVLAAMDVNKPENSVVRKDFNITGFPTILYFENGQQKVKYDGENTKEGIMSFMKNPAKVQEKSPESDWSVDVVQLTDETFDSVLLINPSVLVMFYAPWCAHCKKMKPEFMTAGFNMKENNIPGVLGVVDATKEKTIAERFKISSYPTVKYFKNSAMLFDVNVRTADKIVEFMKDPQEPPPPPPPEIPWSDVPSSVTHLKEDDFRAFLKRKKHALVMFYAPWCGHCKNAKPEFEAAASYFKDDPKVKFAALDCTTQASICNLHNVRGYPTIKYFSYYKVEKLYEGQRQESNFVEYIKTMIEGKQPPAPPPPSLPEDWWKSLPGGGNVKLLTAATFDDTISAHHSALVMFYAPWCGHCNGMKPAYATAATKLKSIKGDSVLAAVDVTVEQDLGTKYEVKGYPTIKYFKNGKFVMDYEKPRTVHDIVLFMTNTPDAKEEL